MENVTKADHICTITEQGGDVQLLRCIGKNFYYVPHMVEQEKASFDFRKEFQIGKDIPLLAHVANFWPVKNHSGLIQQMKKVHGDWRLVFIGENHDEQVEQDVKRAIADDPRFIFLGSQSHDVVISLIHHADLLLLSSDGEGCPWLFWRL